MSTNNVDKVSSNIFMILDEDDDTLSYFAALAAD